VIGPEPEPPEKARVSGVRAVPAVEVSVSVAGVAGMKFTVVAGEETSPCPCTDDSPLTVTMHEPGPVAESCVSPLTMEQFAVPALSSV
jgi:hypothetical protein